MNFQHEYVILSNKRSNKRLKPYFYVLAGTLLLYEIYWAKTEYLLDNIGAVCISIMALLPSYLWCSSQVKGMPIFPAFVLSYIWTSALPLVNDAPLVMAYQVSDRFFASMTVTGFLGLATFVWFRFATQEPSPPKFYRALPSQKGTEFFFLSLGVSVLYNINGAGGWIAIDSSIFSIVRSSVIALTALATFALSYQLGNQKLSRKQSILFIGLVIAFMITGAVSFLLVGSASVFAFSVAGFILGRRVVPILPLVLMLALLTFFHAGKADMRGKYWFNPAQTPYVQPWEYPALYAEWSDYAWKRLTAPKVEQSQESFTERAGIIQMLLLTQTNTPTPIPYLYGKTYAIIPQLLLPRFLNNSKIIGHTGTHMLNIHYGRQTEQDTQTTTIAWGLLAESYANFGLLGCAGLAMVLGAVYGQATYWSINMPILSARSLFAALLLSVGIQAESSAGIFVSSLFQASSILLVLAVVMMTNCRFTPQPLQDR